MISRRALFSFFSAAPIGAVAAMKAAVIPGAYIIDFDPSEIEFVPTGVSWDKARARMDPES
jgi:hypothetical protein